MKTHRVLACFAAAAIVVVGPLLGVMASSADDSTPKPGVTPGTISDQVGAGSLDDRQMALTGVLTAWSTQNPGALADYSVDALDLSVHLSRVATGLSDTQLADLTERVHAVEPSSTITVREVSVTRAEVTAVRDRIRADDASLRARYGPIAANVNDDVSGVSVTVEKGDISAIQEQLRATYGSLVTVENSTFREDSRGHDSPPFFAGIPLWLSSGAFDCTSGPWVNKPGYGNYMLTAGHCVNFTTGVSLYTATASAPTSLTAVGYSGAVSSTADAALMTGSYNANLWLGGQFSTTFHSVDRRVVSEAVGTVVCAGGAVTGGVCRNNISDLDYVTPAGVHTVMACNTDSIDPSQPGDSGASVYHNTSSNLLYVHGIDVGDFVNNLCFVYVPMYRLENALGIQLNLSGN